LEDARRMGFLGPGEVLSHLRHAEGIASLVEEAIGSDSGPTELCDLGAGGGVPGLVMLCLWPEARGALVEASHRRCEALREAVELLGLGGRVRVMEGRAELLARDSDMREHFPVVVARSFARPPVTAEVAAGYVAVGGFLVVSEPADTVLSERWPVERLADLGFGAARLARVAGATAAVMRKSNAVGDRWPRRVGVPAKRPLW